MNTDCEQTLLEISDHLDQAEPLTPTAESHLQTCHECTTFLNAWKPTGTLTTSASTQTPSTPSFADQIMATLPQPEKQPKRLIPFTPLLATAAAITLGFFIWKPSQTPTQTTTPIAKTTTQIPNEIPDLLANINQENISNKVADFGQASTSLINNSAKNISKITSKLEYVSTNLSKIIPSLTPQNKLDTNIPTVSTAA